MWTHICRFHLHQQRPCSVMNLIHDTPFSIPRFALVSESGLPIYSPVVFHQQVPPGSPLWKWGCKDGLCRPSTEAAWSESPAQGKASLFEWKLLLSRILVRIPPSHAVDGRAGVARGRMQIRVHTI